MMKTAQWNSYGHSCSGRMALVGLVAVAGLVAGSPAQAVDEPAGPASPDAIGLRTAGEDAAGTVSQAPPELTDTSWRLVEFQSMDDAIGTVRPDDPSVYTMDLKADGTVAMLLDCNRATGTWSAEASSSRVSGRFEFGPLAVTRALCPPPTMGEQIAAQAEYVRSYLLRDGWLYLSLMADAGIYVWEPRAGGDEIYAAPEDGGARAWEAAAASGTLELREQPSATAGVIDGIPSGTILTNLGCERVDDEFWCDVQPLDGGARGYAPGTSLTAAVSPNGAVVTGPDDSAHRAGQGNFDATGYISCAQADGQPTTQCSFGVARAGGGYATVVVERPDGTSRAIFFQMGKPIGADTSQADGYPEFSATKQADLHFIRIGAERYEIPDAVVLGG